MAKDTQDLHIKLNDLVDVPTLVAAAYLFNPYAVLNCVAQTSTVWSNVFLAAYFYFMARKQPLPCCLFLALETQRNFYPFVLIVPAAIQISELNENYDSTFDSGRNFCWKGFCRVLALFALTLAALNVAASYVTGDWTFIDSTYGFM